MLSGGPGNDTFVFDTLKAATTASGSTGMFSALAAAAVTSNLDTITDFTAGQDVIDLRGLFQSLGYAGTNPVADGWLQLVQSVAGTSFVIDPHNGQSAVTELTAQNVSASTLHQGTDFLTVSPQV